VNIFLLTWLICAKAGMLVKCTLDEMRGWLTGQRTTSMPADRSQPVDNKANISC
jgi:hypothetical protein